MMMTSPCAVATMIFPGRLPLVDFTRRRLELHEPLLWLKAAIRERPQAAILGRENALSKKDIKHKLNPNNISIC
jgi:hypothetical protein